MSALSWYLIYTNPKQEDRTDKNLRAWNVETFAPKLKERRYHPYTNEPIYTVKPLFPRYIFARFSLATHFHKVRYTRGVLDIVGFGDGPVVVEPDVMEFLRSRVKADGFARNDLELEPGEKVIIKEGPFAGLSGIFERQAGDIERVRLLLETVSYQVHVTVERGLLKRA